MIITNFVRFVLALFCHHSIMLVNDNNSKGKFAVEAYHHFWEFPCESRLEEAECCLISHTVNKCQN